MASKALQIMLILVATHAALCQDNFIGSVMSDANSESLCKATVISTRHAVTTARCASVEANKKLAIQFATPNGQFLFQYKTICHHTNYFVPSEIRCEDNFHPSGLCRE